MNKGANLSATEEFRLLPYLAADLRRARVVLYGPAAGEVSRLRLWLGLFSPRFAPVLLCRLAYLFHRNKLGALAKLVSLLNFVIFGIEIAVRCPIGKGLFFPHTQGTVIGAWSIGENATIYHGVTFGAKEVDFSYLETSRPTIGDDVLVGSGAKVLGGLSVGSGSRIGANAVVLESVPASALAAGVPARVVKPLS